VAIDGGPPPDADARELERLGYAQELRRRLGAFSSFAIGFSVISVLTGVTAAFGEALGAGGPGGLGLGWPLVAGGTMVVALAMAELASAFPTAGALYHWSALLGGPGWGWATAMLNLAGQIAITAAIDLACAQALGQLLGAGTAGSLGLFAGVLFVHAALTAGSVRAVAWLNDASATVHFVGVVALSVLLLGGRHHTLAFLRSGIPSASGFVRALVLGVWTFTGFDAAAHVSEETHDPAKRAPLGIVSAVALSAVAGYALVAGLTLSVADPAPLAGQADAALSVLRASLGETTGKIAMAGICLAMWFAGLASLTSSSRMLFAFARDGGLPFASWLRTVRRATATPVNATATCAGAAALLVMATASSERAFLAVAALATIALYASYSVPIALGAVARQRGTWRKPGRFHLGRSGIAVAWAAVVWAGFVFVVCAMANGLAALLFVGMLVAMLGLWVARVRGRFTGPKVDLAHFEERV
jgi:amino acid transporter